METASLVVDLRHCRCGNCKVALGDELAERCPVCGAAFRGVSSNHAGLAKRLREKRLRADPHHARHLPSPTP
ncbi:MAG: hypothetical protein KY476_20490 [Planctomycetes bacterium]|nr:hypothetical protein [Planctomycetota bacterium]